MTKTTVKLDVREDIRNGREPFGKIMQTVARLKDNEQLLLIAPFEPAPLYAMLAQQGFSHQSTPTAWGDWEILFTRGAGDPGSPSTAPPPGFFESAAARRSSKWMPAGWSRRSRS